MTDPGIQLRAATAADFDALTQLFGAAMMFDPTTDEVGRELFEPERALAAELGGGIVGTAKVLTRDLSVPGAVIPAAHVTGVGVRATHRRRGILSALMAEQLRTVPEPVAVLWASEAGIYGRFGYAPAAFGVSYEADLRRVAPQPPPQDSGTLEELAADDAGSALDPLLRRLQQLRPGVSSRSELRWRHRLLDPAEQRGGKSARRILVHRDRSGALDGYALWRAKFDWSAAGPASEVELEELVAPDPSAYRALWQHLLTLDLTAKLRYGHAAVDEPVLQYLGNPVALQRRIGESVWVRITDVARALSQRRYAVQVDVVLELDDSLIPGNAGRYRLTGDLEQARCVPTDDPADLSLSVTELAAVYLGGRPLAEFAATGRVVEQRPGALAAAGAAFGWPVAPAPQEVF
ncbi:GNAT family N-acetyltransferase [Microlunatus sp. GCM10028923]|uniref:GNAT family N-acetyltransferase n=1 Tax=Microlunatus sp. GCM10028923 TaxID=3273400 RepID=UPI003616FA51